MNQEGIKEDLWIILSMEAVLRSLAMAQFTKVSGKEGCLMDQVSFNGLQERRIKEIYEMEWCMEKEQNYGEMENDMKENLRKTKYLEMEKWSSKWETKPSIYEEMKCQQIKVMIFQIHVPTLGNSKTLCSMDMVS